MTWYRRRNWVDHFQETRRFDRFGMPDLRWLPVRLRRALVLGLALLVAFPCVHLVASGLFLSQIGTDVRERPGPDGRVTYWSYAWDGPKAANPHGSPHLPKARLDRVESSPGRTVAHYVDPVGTWTAVEIPASRMALRDGLHRWVLADLAMLACALALAFVMALLAPSKRPRRPLTRA